MSPPVLWATKCVSRAALSSAVIGRPSWSEHINIISIALMYGYILSIWPWKVMLFLDGSEATFSLSDFSKLPEPAI